MIEKFDVMLMLAWLLSGCTGHGIRFTVIEPTQHVQCEGGGTILNDFSPAIVQQEAREAQLYSDQCRKRKATCGTYIEFRYDDRVTQQELEDAISVVVPAFSYAQPIYVRIVYDDHVRSVPLYAIVSVGTVRLLPK